LTKKREGRKEEKVRVRTILGADFGAGVTAGIRREAS
jgi:hypothetical protein